MRTTVTLEKDVERMVRDAMHRERRSFKKVLNAALRAGLSISPKSRKGTPFKVKARPMKLRSGFDPSSFNKLIDALEIDSFMEKQRRPQ